MVRIGLFLFFLKATLLFGQYSIKGIVNDIEGNIIPGVEVKIKAYNYHTTTDRNGEFYFDQINSKISALELSFSLLGYESKSLFIPNVLVKKIHQITLLKKSSNLEEVSLNATRQKNNQSSSSLIELDKDNYGQDIPFLLDKSPSVVTTSDAGTGIGYSGVRIRGVDASRINVTINGIPVNDPESHDVYWVNMPDLASSTENIQIQRGVGTSTNGAAAFGASINVQTNKISKEPYANIDHSIGSFSTLKSSINVGSGLLNDRFSLDMRLSNIRSNGYIDRASANLNSYYLSANYIMKNSLLKAIAFSGKEITYQAWYGTPECRVNGDEQAMMEYADRNWLDSLDSLNLLNSGRTYNYYTYENEVDNYQQDNYQLHFNHALKNNWTLNVAAHYTFGRGFYEQYRKEDQLANYGLSNIIINSDTLYTTDLIRRRWLMNHFYGTVYNLTGFMKNLKTRFTFGGSANNYLGNHFGEIIWARFASNSEIRDLYYNNDAQKMEFSNYLKLKSWLSPKLNFSLDLQQRSIYYSFVGIDDVNGQLVETEQQVPFHFFNPKAAIVYQINLSNLIYLNYGVANREPVRRDFRESTPSNRPSPENMQNIEFGYSAETKKYQYSINSYYMRYKNQLILTGQINDVGGYTRTNVDDSYRLGLEMNGLFQVSNYLSVNGSLSLSDNRIKEFTEFIDDYDNGGQFEVNYSNTSLAFSPGIILSGGVSYFPIKGLECGLITKYIGRQFLDNTSNLSKSLSPYSYTILSIDYTLKMKKIKELRIGCRINNLFNNLYSNNGYTFSYIYGSEKITENFLYPQAGRNVMFRLLIGF